MKQQVLDTCTSDGLENIIAFLKSHNIESKYVDFDKYNYSRTVQFTVNEQVYQIIYSESHFVKVLGDELNITIEIKD